MRDIYYSKKFQAAQDINNGGSGIQNTIPLGTSKNETAMIHAISYGLKAVPGADRAVNVHFLADPKIEGFGSLNIEERNNDPSEIYSFDNFVDAADVGLLGETIYFPEPGIEVPFDLGVHIVASDGYTTAVKYKVLYTKKKATTKRIAELVTYYAIAAEQQGYKELLDVDQDNSSVL